MTANHDLPHQWRGVTAETLARYLLYAAYLVDPQRCEHLLACLSCRVAVRLVPEIELR